MGRAHWRAGAPAEARAHLERARSLAASLDEDGLDDRAGELAVVSGIVLGWVLAELGELLGAERVLAEAGALASTRADRLHETAALNNQAFVLWRRGAVADLPAIYRRVVSLGHELGMPTHAYRAECWMFEVSLVTGRVADARRHAERMSALEETFPELFGAPNGRLALARLAARCADLASASGYLEGIDCAAFSRGHRAIFEAISLAASSERSGARWCEIVAAARAVCDDEAAAEVIGLGTACGASLGPQIAELLDSASLPPAVRATILG